jgi:HSP20 family protein
MCAGLKKEELKIELVEKNNLRISGERHKEDVQDTDQWHRVERSSGRFMRQFRLPENVNSDGISAKLENGVLTVNAPKIKPEAVSNGDGDVRSIDISASDK